MYCPYFNEVDIERTCQAFNRKHYMLFSNGDLNLNIFGIRTNDPTCTHENRFNDVIGVIYKLNGVWQLVKYEATTDPGITSLTSPVNSRGCAILKPGQYRSAFKIGYHKGKYRALVQNVALPLYRDNDRDKKLDACGETTLEMAGINLHHANTSTTNPSTQVDNWSAGCMVIRKITDWDEFMDLIDRSAEIYGSTFTFTLFTQDEYFGC